MMVSPNRFMTDAKLTLAGNLGHLFFGVSTSIVLARSLGAESFGLYALFLVFVNVSVSLTNLGLGRSTTYHVAGQTQFATQIAKASLLVSLLLGLMAALTGYTVFLLLPALFKGLSAQLLLPAILLIVLKIVFQSAQGVVMGLQDFLFYNKLIVAVSFFQAVLVAVLVGILGLGIWWAVIAVLLSNLGALIGALYGIHKRLSEDSPAGVSWNSWVVSLLKCGLKSHLGRVCTSLTNRLDRLLINALAGPLSLGIYQVAVSMAERLSLLSNTTTVLFPRVASMDQHERQRQGLTHKVARSIFWLILMGAIPVFALSDWLIFLFFGEQYESAGSVLKLLLPGFVLLSMSQALAHDFSGRGKPGLNSLHAAGTLALNVAANLFLIPRYGVHGAAAAARLFFGFLAVIRVGAYSRIAKIKWYETWLLTREDLRLWRRLVSKRP